MREFFTVSRTSVYALDVSEGDVEIEARVNQQYSKTPDIFLSHPCFVTGE
jgi:hypothetical protein